MTKKKSKRTSLKSVFKSAFTALSVLVVFTLATSAPLLHKAFIRDSVASRVVKLTGKGSGGTGFHVQAASGKTYILTNAHVCSLHTDHFIEVTYKNYRPTQKRIIEIYKAHDLCLVEGFEGVDGVEIADDVGPGTSTYLVGHPQLKPITLTQGELIYNTEIGLIDCSLFPKGIPLDSALFKNQNIVNFNCFKTRTASNITNYSRPGSSGSPVVNSYENLVGVLFAGSLFDANDSYMVPLSNVKDFLSSY